MQFICDILKHLFFSNLMLFTILYLFVTTIDFSFISFMEQSLRKVDEGELCPRVQSCKAYTFFVISFIFSFRANGEQSARIYRRRKNIFFCS